MRYNKNDTLSGGSRRRLGAMRAYAATWNANPRRHCAITWRDARRHGVGAISSDAHGLKVSQCGGFANVPESVLDGLRWRFASDVLREEGYRDACADFYRDTFDSEVYRGAVWQLPSRDGSECWVAGYVERESMKANAGSMSRYAVLDCARGRVRTFTSAKGAACCARNLAESHAEESREYDEKWQEASRANDEREEARDELKAAREEARCMVAALRAQRAEGAIVPALCDVLRAKVAECRERMRDALTTIRAKVEKIEELGMAGEF